MNTALNTAFNRKATNPIFQEIVRPEGIGTLAPAFTRLGTAYTATVPFSTTSLSVTATSREADSRIEIEDVETASGTASEPFTLEVGENQISVVVFAPDPRQRSTYTVTITRLPAPPPPPAPPASDRERALPSISPVAPPTSAMADGRVAVVVDGVLIDIDVELDPERSAMRVSGDGFAVAVRTASADRRPIPGSPVTGLTAPEGGWVDVDGSGYAPNSPVAVYLVPRLTTRAWRSASVVPVAGALSLGSAEVDGAGRLIQAFPVPLGTANTDWVLQINGVSTENSLRSVNIDMTVTGGKRGSIVRIGTCSFIGSSSQLPSKCRTALDKLLTAIGPTNATMRVAITGVAYGQVDRAQNRSLAQKRAQSIATYLKTKGVDATPRINVVARAGVTPGLTLTPVPLVASADGKPASTLTITIPPAT